MFSFSFSIADNTKLNKLKEHVETDLPDFTSKPEEFFVRMIDNLQTNKRTSLK